MKKKNESEDAKWRKAYRQAARCGITLTKRKNSQGDYVCYLNKKSRNLFGWL